MAARKGLGKGLGALFSEYEEIYENSLKEDETTAEARRESLADELTKISKAENFSGALAKNVAHAVDEGNAVELPIGQIDTNVNQPRKNFDSEAMKELTVSIKQHGVIQPIIVVQRNDRYMIIAGERRWRAAMDANLHTIPAIVKNYSEQQIKEIALIENLQREDLNPVEAARAIKQLMTDYNFTQEQVADRIGKNRSSVTNMLRLLNLRPEVLELIVRGKLSSGHAKCLVVVQDQNLQLKLALAGCDNKVTVREFEKMVSQVMNPKPAKEKKEMSVELKNLISDMQRVFATKITALGNEKRGRIYIDYYSCDDLDRIFELIEQLKVN
ncbi:chromosome partitioning protein ParB [Clostridia bacterium]|nr:chromosome partitioning protein ParB [Clostridia bacterium]